MNAKTRFPLMLLALCSTTWAADYYVDNVNGRDDHDGLSKPLATIGRAIAAAQPGDTIHLKPTGTLYRQSAEFRRGGQPGRPITLDGHGVTLTGADPVPPDAWQPCDDGAMRLPRGRSIGMLIVDGQLVFERQAMDALEPGEFCDQPDGLHGRPPQGRRLQDLEIDVGQEGKPDVRLDPKAWGGSHSQLRDVLRYRGIRQPAWVRVNGVPAPLIQARQRLQPGMWCNHEGDLYYRPPAGRSIGQLAIEVVTRSNGVALAGRFGHVVIRNLTAIHMGNDGYNIHGQVTQAEFYNCHAHHCFDEGFSAHDDCQTLLDGAVYGFCDNGIANVNTSGWSITRHVVLHHSRHVGFLIQSGPQPVRHELSHAVLFDNPVQISASCLTADNVLLVSSPRADRRAVTAVDVGRQVDLTRVTWTHGTIASRQGGRLTISSGLGGADPLHMRVDDPAGILTLKRVVVDPACVLEWGARYPWKRQPLAEWFQSGRFEACAVHKHEALTALSEGRLPALAQTEVGCEAALWKRFVEVFQTAP